MLYPLDAAKGDTEGSRGVVVGTSHKVFPSGPLLKIHFHSLHDLGKSSLHLALPHNVVFGVDLVGVTGIRGGGGRLRG